MKIIGVIGTGFWVLMNFIIGVSILSSFVLVGIMIYLIWVVVTDYKDERAIPLYHIVDLRQNIIRIEMDDGSSGQIPFEDIESLELGREHRSPIWANSVGVNYIHYHVNVIRKNSGVWTLTSSTQEGESTQVLNQLRQLISLRLPPAEFDIRLPKTVHAFGDDPLVIQWSSYQTLTIQRSILVFENKKRKILREFALHDFNRVTYSLLDSQEDISVIAFYFNQGAGAELKFNMNTTLSPVDCLQVERWLGQFLRKKLSA